MTPQQSKKPLKGQTNLVFTFAQPFIVEAGDSTFKPDIMNPEPSELIAR